MGKACSEETRLKISLALKGKKVSEDAKKNMRLAKLGRTLSEEHRAAISAGNIGRHSEGISSLKGRPLTEEHKARIAKSAKGNPKYSHNPSEETRKKISIANTKEGSAYRGLLGKYKKGAEDRGLSWELTEEQFRSLTTSDCYYTGRKPSQEFTAASGEVYTYSGIDRLDSSVGYTVDNCVPCCTQVNRMKMAMGINEFLELVSEVNGYRGKDNNVRLSFATTSA
jgi:hypothetical protein